MSSNRTALIALLVGLACPLSPVAAQQTTVHGLVLPADALPYSQQVYRIPCNNTRNEITFDFSVALL